MNSTIRTERTAAEIVREAIENTNAQRLEALLIACQPVDGDANKLLGAILTEEWEPVDKRNIPEGRPPLMFRAKIRGFRRVIEIDELNWELRCTVVKSTTEKGMLAYVEMMRDLLSDDLTIAEYTTIVLVTDATGKPMAEDIYAGDRKEPPLIAWQESMRLADRVGYAQASHNFKYVKLVP